MDEQTSMTKPIVVLRNFAKAPKIGRKVVPAHAPKSSRKHEDVTVLWNQGLHTSREGMADRLGLMFKIKKKQTCVQS
jgi:hypothetical protein